ncbi:MAG: NUDIX domain-containing protein [Anaerolineaceae bacterium]|nr:NUDIX domain-containing protein [Anaerolineaceae bacterium]
MKRIDVALNFWRMIEGRLQWYLLWLLNPKVFVGVSGLIFNERNELLLVQHRFRRGDTWDLPGGIAKRAETFEQTLIREIWEETQLNVVPQSLALVNSGFRTRIEVFLLAEAEVGEMRLDPREILAADFFALDQIPAQVLPSHRTVIEKVKQMGLLNPYL